MNRYVPAFPGILEWELLHPEMTLDGLGYLPGLFSSADPRPAREQVAERYRGDWHPSRLKDLKLIDGWLKFPGDPDMPALARAKLRSEYIVFFDCSWLAIVQEDGSYEISRVD